MNEFNESLDANVSSTDREHRTALHYAAMDGDVEAVDGLIEAGSNVNAADDGGYTPLHFAAQYLRSEVITLLIAVGALAVLDAEQNVTGSNIRTIGNAVWWALVTITTVGYGDFYPITLVGRIVAVALMVGGIAILGVVTATLASWLIEQVGQRAAVEAELSEEPMRAELAEMNLKIDHLTGLLENLSNPTGR